MSAAPANDRPTADDDSASAPPSETRMVAAMRVFGHDFANAELLLQACTHASRCGAQATARQRLDQANERLEFLGDAMLGAALCVLFYRRFPDANEGQLSRLKARLASRAALARVIESCDFLPHCLVGAQMSTPWPDSVKANLMESLLAALYLDGGWAPLLATVERLFGELLDDSTAGDEDPKTRLQEWSLEHHSQLPMYRCERSGGTDHVPEFTAMVAIAGAQGEGRGSSRRRAETAAAAALWEVLHPDQTPA